MHFLQVAHAIIENSILDVCGMVLLAAWCLRRVVLPYCTSKVRDFAKWAVRLLLRYLLLGCAACLVAKGLFSSGAKLVTLIFLRAQVVRAMMENGVPASTAATIGGSLAAAGILGFAALQPARKCLGGRPGHSAQSMERANPEISPPSSAVPVARVCAAEDKDAQVNQYNAILARSLETKIASRMKPFEEDLEELFSRVRSLEKLVKGQRSERQDGKGMSLSASYKRLLNKDWEDVRVDVERLERVVEDNEERLEVNEQRAQDIGKQQNSHGKRIEWLEKEFKELFHRFWDMDREMDQRKLRVAASATTAAHNSQAVEQKWVQEGEDSRSRERNYGSPQKSVRTMESARREASPSPVRYGKSSIFADDPELEFYMTHEVTLPEDFYRRYPEHVILQVLMERKRRRPKAPGSGHFLSEEEVAVAQRSLAELAVMWRRYRCQEDGRPMRDFEWDRWDLGALTPEECKMNRADIKRILTRRREDMSARLAAEAGRPKEHCNQCGNWHNANKTCVASRYSTPTKRPGIVERTVLQSSGRNNLTVRTVPVPDGEELRKEALRLQAVKQSVEEREALAQSLSRSQRVEDRTTLLPVPDGHYQSPTVQDQHMEDGHNQSF